MGQILFVVVLSILTGVVLFTLSTLGIIKYIDVLSSELYSSFLNIWLFFIPFVLFFNQDNVNSSGIVHRFFGVQIVSNKTNLPSSPIKCFVRNISLIILPWEAIFWLLSPSRGIGDYIFGTKLITNPSITLSKKYTIKSYFNYIINSMVIAALISYLFAVLISNINNDVSINESKYHLYIEEEIDNATVLKKQLFENGIIKIQYKLKKDKYDGFYEEWNELGVPIIKIEYKNGVREGVTKTYYTNGQIESEILYSNNEFVKYIAKWDKDGNEISDSK